jgi:hypothetical protein
MREKDRIDVTTGELNVDPCTKDYAYPYTCGCAAVQTAVSEGRQQKGVTTELKETAVQLESLRKRNNFQDCASFNTGASKIRAGYLPYHKCISI